MNEPGVVKKGFVSPWGLQCRDIMIMYKVPEYNETASKGYQAREDEWHGKHSVRSLANVIPYYRLSHKMNDFLFLHSTLWLFSPRNHLKTQLGLFFSSDLSSGSKSRWEYIYTHNARRCQMHVWWNRMKSFSASDSATGCNTESNVSSQRRNWQTLFFFIFNFWKWNLPQKKFISLSQCVWLQQKELHFPRFSLFKYIRGNTKTLPIASANVHCLGLHPWMSRN